MRKLLWIGALLAMLGGVYWSVAHATVHPQSPVGRTMAWFGVVKSTPAKADSCSLTSTEPACSRCSEVPTQTIHVEARKPVGLIVIHPDFVPMPDAEGHEAYTPTAARTVAVREVVENPEEFRIMPEPEAPAPRGTITIGLKLSQENCCPLDLFCQVKFDDCCRMLSFSGMYNYVHGKVTGKDISGACCKEGCKGCPVACKECPAGCKICPASKPVKVERLTEPPVEVEESEPGVKPMGWYRWIQQSAKPITPRPVIE